MPNFLTAEKLNVNIKQEQKPTMRDYTKFDSKKLAKEINDLKLIYSEINAKYDFFHKSIMEVINNNALIREQTKMECSNQRANKNEKKPCVKKGILKSIKTKNILLKQFLRNKDRLTYFYNTRHIGTK